MARLKAHKIKLLGVDLELPINVNSKGHFKVNLPDEIWERIKNVSEQFTTFDECIETINKYVKEVNEMETKIDWILVYQINSKIKKNSYDSVCKMEIIYTPLKRTIRGKEVVYNYVSYDTFQTHLDNDCPIPNFHALGNKMGDFHHQEDMAHPESKRSKILPLTIANITFFQDLCEEIRKLNDKIEAFLKDPEILEIKILEARGVKFLSE